jgi:hypothetical protein
LKPANGDKGWPFRSRGRRGGRLGNGSLLFRRRRSEESRKAGGSRTLDSSDGGDRYLSLVAHPGGDLIERWQPLRGALASRSRSRGKHSRRLLGGFRFAVGETEVHLLDPRFGRDPRRVLTSELFEDGKRGLETWGRESVVEYCRRFGWCFGEERGRGRRGCLQLGKEEHTALELLALVLFERDLLPKSGWLLRSNSGIPLSRGLQHSLKSLSLQAFSSNGRIAWTKRGELSCSVVRTDGRGRQMLLSEAVIVLQFERGPRKGRSWFFDRFFIRGRSNGDFWDLDGGVELHFIIIR